MESYAFIAVQWIAILFLGLMLGLALFEPSLPYKVTETPADPLDSEGFRRLLASLAGSHSHDGCRMEVLTNGEVFYEAELQAIREARHSVNLEAYIFGKGKVTHRFLDALTERAAAGVRCNVVLDAIGAFATWERYFAEFREAGGRVFFYHPLQWYTLPRINNRTHRELIVVDGRVGFVGGAGFADHWRFPHGRRQRPAWRDTMFRVEGRIVRDLQSVFAENWLESSGELLTEPGYFPPLEDCGASTAMVVCSTPTTGRSARNRMVYQTLLAAAQRTIEITTPYFLPDRSACTEMVRAIRERGVAVTILTPGQHSDHLLTRRASRRLYGPLLKAGARIHEYEPTMIHAKVLVIDGIWSVVGSTNFDNRSFGINDEINVAAFDADLAARLQEDFARDLTRSRRITYRKWYRRPLVERAWELLGWLLERQQ
jgi:cardiolipin synthase A/B